MQKIAIYPGSFDPITKGHIDIIKRSAKLVDKLVVGVLVNANKKYWFDNAERENMVKESLKDIENIEVVSFDGLLVDFMQQNNISLVIRGLRSVSDYEYELQLALTNRSYSEYNIETIFIPASQDFQYMSSSIVREVAINKGKLEMFIPECLVATVKHRAIDILEIDK